jgi:hypothetical protein
MIAYFIAALAAVAVLAVGAHAGARAHGPILAAENWLIGQFRHGLHDGPDLGGFHDPEPVPEGWTPLLSGSVDDVRREHGKHARTQPRQPLTEQVIEVAEAPGHAPWSGSFPALDAAAEAEQGRVDFARSQLEQHDPADITPELLQGVLDSLRAMPVYGEKPVAAVLEAERAQRLAAGYDPADDNCAGTPSCGSERVLFKHYGMDMFACPRCYENVFGGAPDPAFVFTIAVDEAQAGVMQP